MIEPSDYPIYALRSTQIPNCEIRSGFGFLVRFNEEMVTDYIEIGNTRFSFTKIENTMTQEISGLEYKWVIDDHQFEIQLSRWDGGLTDAPLSEACINEVRELMIMSESIGFGLD